jgi:hypothetical protein
MIIFLAYETLVTGPESSGQDPAGQDSKFSDKFESHYYQGVL